MLPIPVILALLRLIRNRPAEPEDEDVLFDHFGVVGSDRVLARARARVGADGQLDLDALLVDMLRSEMRRRQERRTAA